MPSSPSLSLCGPTALSLTRALLLFLSRDAGDNVGPTWITQTELKILNQTCEVPLPREVTYPDVPGTRSWTFLGPV